MEVPKEAVEFARLLVRVFHGHDSVVAMDGVLRSNNYVSHNDLANRLKLGPKELRVVMVKLQNARLMKLEKRNQKHINVLDERRSSRSVQTEFWYVPLREMIDAFIYRVHHISNSLEAKLIQSQENRRYVCMRCKYEYSDLDVVSRMDENTGQFLCDVFGTVMGRRPRVCGGIIKEQDMNEERKNVEALKRKFDADLKPLRERAEKLATMSIPAHPLDGADAETWNVLAPETVDESAEGYGADGHGNASRQASIPAIQSGEKEKSTQVAAPPPDDEPIPEKPSWFKEGGGGDDDEDDWDQEAPQKNLLNNSTGTASKFNLVDSEAYIRQYMAAMGETEEGNAEMNIDMLEEENPIEENLDNEKPMEVESSGDIKEAIGAAYPSTTEPEAATEEVYVKVAGRSVKLSEVTEDMEGEMTPEEFKAYFAIARNQDDEDDDDDEFV